MFDLRDGASADAIRRSDAAQRATAEVSKIALDGTGNLLVDFGVCAPAAVHGVRHRLEMGGVDAVPDSAEVIKVKSCGDRADVLLIEPSVSVAVGVRLAHDRIPGARPCAVPQPATRLKIDGVGTFKVQLPAFVARVSRKETQSVAALDACPLVVPPCDEGGLPATARA